jgi:hypothetical protein
MMLHPHFSQYRALMLASRQRALRARRRRFALVAFMFTIGAGVAVLFPGCGPL